MTATKIFVSYSHRDVKSLDRLMRFVRPLERDGHLTAWTDEALAGGDLWAGEIAAALEAATIAVLLISQDFVDSEFITQQEVPQILARQAAGGLTVIPVFLNHSLVKEIHYSFLHPKTGKQETALLTKFHGYGTEGRPLAALRGPQREAVYVELGRRLLSLAGAEPLPSVRPAATVAPIPHSVATIPAGSTQSYQLTVRFERRNGGLEVAYHLPGGAPFGHWTLSWAELRQRSGPIAAALDGEAPLPREKQDSWGEELWQILFGANGSAGATERWQPILRTLFVRGSDSPQPHPTWAPVRLRVATEEPLLAGLPWRWTSWNRQRLLDFRWVFSMSSLTESATDVQTTAPSQVLLVLPPVEGDGGAHDRDHERALLEVLAQAWPTGRDAGYVRIARTRDEWIAGLQDRLHLLYVYAPDIELSGFCESLAGSGHTPDVVYLNTAGPGDPESEGLLDRLPLLLTRRRPRWSADSATTAIHWLRRWLEKGEDPVAALHEVQRQTSVPGDEPATLRVRAQYRSWKILTYQGAPARQNPSLLIDREDQKSLVRKHVEELARESHRRVLALIPFAAPGHSLAQIHAQLFHDLQLSFAHQADIRQIRLALPPGDAWRQTDLEGDWRQQLAAGAREADGALLRRYAPKAGRKPLLWFDWGTCTGRPPKSSHLDPLAEWLRFVAHFLGGHCPPDLRLVCSLAVEIPAAEHDAFTKDLQELRRELRSPIFRLSDLRPLGEVSVDHLLEYLTHSSCDAAIQEDLAERLVEKTGGRFQETVDLVEEAENVSWYDLLARLKREQGPGRPQ